MTDLERIELAARRASTRMPTRDLQDAFYHFAEELCRVYRSKQEQIKSQVVQQQYDAAPELVEVLGQERVIGELVKIGGRVHCWDGVEWQRVE